MEEKIYILSTRPLPQSILDEAEGQHVQIDTISFIHTEPIINNELKQQLISFFSKQLVAVFTSMNAVEAVAACSSGQKPAWKIFCIGDTTAALIREYFGQNSIAGTAQSAIELADVIIDAGVEQAVFFCGDMRRPELPDKLSANNIALEEIMVYKTIATPKQVENNYDGILFFSPSAAESFFAANTVKSNAVLFAIGDTTASTIQRFTGNAIVTGARPGKEMLAQQAIAYFKSIRALR